MTEKNDATIKEVEKILVKMNEDSLSEDLVGEEVDAVIERVKEKPDVLIPFLRKCLEHQIVAEKKVLKDESLPAALVLGKMINKGILKDKMDVKLVTKEIEAFKAKRKLLSKIEYIDY